MAEIQKDLRVFVSVLGFWWDDSSQIISSLKFFINTLILNVLIYSFYFLKRLGKNPVLGFSFCTIWLFSFFIPPNNFSFSNFFAER
ncbi:hypothetical protein IMCC3317_26150 [Kordia antarctica]|uniref:Uncharacterized protein n=1 Tax=Kordia antarctica TaxID=1218801 RepID=A0A7L4ZL91_9FLAO|nr:hypothetical protein IMCC3317_26150 [Kordia antarctica]